jgi:hypothetical protein
MQRAFYGLLVLLSLVGCNSYVDKVNVAEIKKLTGIDGRQAVDASFAIEDINKRLFSRARDSITYTDGSYLTREGFGPFRLPRKFKFITQNQKYVLASKDNGRFLLIDKATKKVLIAKVLSYPMVSGKILGDRIFYIALNNIFGIYSISQNRNLVAAKVGKAYAVDTRTANPMLIKNLLVVPTLDGKLLVVNPNQPTGASGMAIGKSFNLNNVIFLGKIGNKIIASTPSKLISAAPGSMHKFETPIADMTISNGRIYLLARDGRIIILSPDLKVIRSKKFKKYNRFLSIAVVGNSIFALDGDGFLLVTNSTLSREKIYDVGAVNSYSFVAGDKLYKDSQVVYLQKLRF